MANTTTVSTERSPSLFKRLLIWILLAVVGLLAAAGIIGGALEYVGVPVIKTVTDWVMPLPKKHEANGTASSQNALSSQMAVQVAENHSLENQLSLDTQKLQALKAEVKKLEAEQGVQVTDHAAAETEANILVQMDPQKAAAVLENMKFTAAARTIAVMQASDSGQILADVPPQLASKLIAAAALDEKPTVSANTNSATS